MRQIIHATVHADSGGYVAECANLHAVTEGLVIVELERLRGAA